MKIAAALPEHVKPSKDAAMPSPQDAPPSDSDSNAGAATGDGGADDMSDDSDPEGTAPKPVATKGALDNQPAISSSTDKKPSQSPSQPPKLQPNQPKPSPKLPAKPAVQPQQQPPATEPSPYDPQQINQPGAFGYQQSLPEGGARGYLILGTKFLTSAQ